MPVPAVVPSAKEKAPVEHPDPAKTCRTRSSPGQTGDQGGHYSGESQGHDLDTAG